MAHEHSVWQHPSRGLKGGTVQHRVPKSGAWHVNTVLGSISAEVHIEGILGPKIASSCARHVNQRLRVVVQVM
jgi:hypothetical protein